MLAVLRTSAIAIPTVLAELCGRSVAAEAALAYQGRTLKLSVDPARDSTRTP